MKVKTNDLKKGAKVMLTGGMAAVIMDNKKGNTRVAEVYGPHTETGSIYSHEILWAEINGVMVEVEHTPEQVKCRAMTKALFGG